MGAFSELFTALEQWKASRHRSL